MSEVLRENNPRKIFVANGVLHGHFTGSVEVVRELAELGYDVTCFVTDEFADRLNDIPVKKIVYSSDVSEVAKKMPPYVPPFAINSFFWSARQHIWSLSIYCRIKQTMITISLMLSLILKR